MEINIELLYKKLGHLRKHISELAAIKDVTFAEYKENFLIHRSVEKLLQLIVEAAVDINSHIIAKKLLKPARSY